MRRALLLLAKASTSILLLYLSLRWVNVSVLIERLSRIEFGWIVLALFLMVVQVALLAARWQTIAAACGANLRFMLVLQFNFIATFFNQVLPSTIGGDGARIWLLARKGSGWASAIYSVLIDRIAGVFVLALVVIACLPWTFSLIPDLIPRVVLLVIGFGTVTGVLIFIMVGAQFRHTFDQWSLHSAFVGCFTHHSNAVQLSPVRHDYIRLLSHEPLAHCRRRVVLHQSGRRSG